MQQYQGLRAKWVTAADDASASRVKGVPNLRDGKASAFDPRLSKPGAHDGYTIDVCKKS